MKHFLILLSISAVFSSCAKLSYLAAQGYGQAKLQWKGRSNSEVLKDPKISPSHKRKIELVEEYKKYFYFYFNQDPTAIYSKTTILDNKAVTYLVVASPHTKMKAHEFEFPLMGSFPYLGFFNLDSAKSFADELEKQDRLVTWIRPVYAYSTLGYLEDRILSSFFYYDDIELAELIFHELFHTIFFIKDEVELNENLANLFGKELLQEFFQDRPELSQYLEDEKKKDILDRRIVELISILQAEFDKLGIFINDKKADELTKRFVDEIFKPDLRSLCFELKLEEEDCEFKEEWNQAAFAAFLTYEEEQDFLKELQTKLGLNLKDFLIWLKKQYKGFHSNQKTPSFTDFLKSQVIDAAPSSH